MSQPRPESWSLGSCAVVGDGQIGRALVASLPRLKGPFGRDFDGVGFDIVILAVPDGEITRAADAIRLGPLVGHCAGSMGTDVLSPHEGFALHPLMTVTDDGAQFSGASAAVSGSTPRALGVAHALAHALSMDTFEIADVDRAAYHAAASIASNLLVTLEDAAEIMVRTAGADRKILVPLIRATIENWAGLGASGALTGPIKRGDEATVARQRAAIVERAPELTELFDVLCERTRTIAARTDR